MVKKLCITFSILFVLLFLLAAPDDYYSRKERLLAGINTVELQANALPILTGALDELRKYPQDNYYKNIIVLADAKENRSWRAYENSRRLAAAQLNEQVFSRTTLGDRRYFYDEEFGARYKKEDRRLGREMFFVNYRKQSKGADGYVNNIFISPSQYLDNLLTVDLPDLPDPAAEDFVLPKLPVVPLDEREPFDRTPKDFQWRLQVEPVSGIRKRVDAQTIVPAQTIGVALKIISPEGAVINQEELRQFLPMMTVVPIRNNQFLFFKNLPKNADRLEFSADLTQTSADKPLIAQYSLPAFIKVVEFTVSDKLGRPIYVKKESAPDPYNPIAFSWLPDKKGGEYYASLKGYDADNQVAAANPKPISLAGANSAHLDYQIVPHKPSGEYYSVVELQALSVLRGANKVYFWLYGTEDNSGRPIAASLYVLGEQE